MAFGAIKLVPGVNTIATPTLNEAGVSKSSLIRYRGGLIEKLGGWQAFVPTAMDSTTRALKAWEDLSSNAWLGVGNLDSVKAIQGASITDITPQVLTSNAVINVSTTQGSRIVTIVDTNVTDIFPTSSVFFNTPISVGGLILSGQAAIRPTPAGNIYTIEWRYPATSVAVNAGTVPVFTTTAGSALVNVLLADHGVADGGTFVFPIPTIIGGITISGIYKGCRQVDANNFTIVASMAATSAATVTMNSGQMQLYYGVTNGWAQVGSAGGMGPLGEYAIGEGFAVHTTTTSQTGTRLSVTDWTLANWGELLVACQDGGQIWYWEPNSGYTTMQPVGSGPAFNTGIFVAMPAQILVAYGSTSSTSGANTDAAQDKLIVRWSEQLDFTVWTVSSLTQAGSYHIPTGSEIRGGIQGAGVAYIFTDVDVWSMNYLGYPDVFGFTNISTSGGLIGKHAVTELRGSIYWMGNDNFYVASSGSISVMPCTVWDTVFQDLDTDNAHKCVAGANPDFNEIWFFYPSVSGGTGECDKYVKVNILENYVWDYGSIPRSAWLPASVIGPPIGADPDTLLLQQHETTYSDNGNPMDSYFETGFFPFGDGENFAVIDELQPDMKFTTLNSSTPSASISAILTAVNYPTSTAAMVSTMTMTSTTAYLTPRVRGRQAKWRVGTNDATSWWRTGAIRYRFGVDGRR